MTKTPACKYGRGDCHQPVTHRLRPPIARPSAKSVWLCSVHTAVIRADAGLQITSRLVEVAA